MKKGHALRASVDVLYKNAEVKPDIFFESHSNMLSYRLAAKGLGVAVIPEITLELMEGGMEAEAYHLSDNPVQWPLMALYREGCYIGEVEQALLDIAKETMQAHKKKLWDSFVKMKFYL
ncbi:MAG: LysR family transcriptional regulator substrate-binding protein [Clostridium sp.]